MCINTNQYRHDPSIISKQKMVTLKHLNWHCRLTSFHHCQYVVCHSISFHMTGILASPAHGRFKPMQFGVCRIRKAWRNWRCGVVCLTLFDKAVYKCLHWFLLLIGYLCIDMHCKIRSCLDGRLYYLSLLFFLGARVSERQLVARESSQNRNTSLTTLIWKITGNHGNHGHFFRELHFGFHPWWNAPLFLGNCCNWCFSEHTEIEVVLWTTSVTARWRSLTIPSCGKLVFNKLPGHWHTDETLDKFDKKNEFRVFTVLRILQYHNYKFNYYTHHKWPPS